MPLKTQSAWAEKMQDVPRLFERGRRRETYDRRKSGGWEYRDAAVLALAETKRAGSCRVVANTKREVLANCPNRALTESSLPLAATLESLHPSHFSTIVDAGCGIAVMRSTQTSIAIKIGVQ